MDKSVGIRIQKLRKQHNYTREEFADMINISSKFLYEIETGKKGFSADILKRLSQTLSTSCDYLLTGELHSSPNSSKCACPFQKITCDQITKLQTILLNLEKSDNSI